MNEERYVILGTAGHIDHGKTALVYALTGKNTDRLKEEQARGISIDIDFAPLRFDDGLLVGMVDVPGHERFIRNMLAGAAGIDAALLAVDVNEGVKPQTTEHLAILQLLGVQRLVVALTKCDLADPEWIAMVSEVIHDTLADGPYAEALVIPTSAVSGLGLPELKHALHDLALEVAQRDAVGAFRLPVDKVFSVPGFGTVVSGTIWRGRVEVGQQVEVLPHRTMVRVRGIQSHGKPVTSAQAGQRAALNLVGIGRDEMTRGNEVVRPGTLTETRLIDAHVNVLPGYESGLAHRARVHVHLGTAQAVGRVLVLKADGVEAGKSAYVQLMLDTPLVCEAGDRFVIRSYSPVTTVGGGHVVNPSASRLYRRRRPQLIEQLALRDSASPLERIVQMANTKPVNQSEVVKELGCTTEEATLLLTSGEKNQRLVALPSGWMDVAAIKVLLEECLQVMQEVHHKHRFRAWLALRDITSPSLRKLAQRDVEWVFQEGTRRGLWTLQSGQVHAADWEVQLTVEEQSMYNDMLRVLGDTGIEGRPRAELTGMFPKRDRVADALLHYAMDLGTVVQLSDGALLATTVYEELVAKLRGLYEEQGEFTVAEARDLFQSSRKPTLNLLETLDAGGYTVRFGDLRRFVS